MAPMAVKNANSSSHVTDISAASKMLVGSRVAYSQRDGLAQLVHKSSRRIKGVVYTCIKDYFALVPWEFMLQRRARSVWEWMCFEGQL